MSEGRDEETGRFAPGNRIWEARSTAGPKPKFADPESLWSACVEYFQWVDENPLKERKAWNASGVIVTEDMPKMRAMTIGGLCLFIGISHRQWIEWRTSRPDLLQVLETVEQVIYEQKFAGAAADLLNPNIIARDLGLADRKEHTGKDGGAIKTESTTDVELARQVAFLLASGVQKGE